MARSGLTKTQVQITRDLLLAEGRYPSVEAVRAALGDTGSKSTIHKYLKELEAESIPAPRAPIGAVNGLQGLIEQLSAQLHADVDRRLATIRTEYEVALRQKDQQLTELRASMESMGTRLRELEGTALTPSAPAGAEASVPMPPGQSGFGLFGSLLSASRAGTHAASAFSALLDNPRTSIANWDEITAVPLKTWSRH
jgi:hypothetical protein